MIDTKNLISFFISDSPQYHYILDGDPTPLMRPRMGSRGQYRTVYDAQHHIKLVKGIYLRNQHLDRPALVGALALTVVFYMPLRDSWSAKKRDAMRGKPHLIVPDFSNLLKFMEDISQDVKVIVNDCQIVAVLGAKIYTDDKPRTEFMFQEIRE